MRTVLIVILFLFQGAVTIAQRCEICGPCTHRVKRKIEKHQARPEIQDTFLLNAVFVGSGIRSMPDGTERATYSFTRYFANGKVFHSCPYLSFPEFAEFSKFDYGNFYIYEVNDTVLLETRWNGAAGFYDMEYVLGSEGVFLSPEHEAPLMQRIPFPTR